MTYQLGDVLIDETRSLSLPKMSIYVVRVGHFDDPKLGSGYTFATKPDNTKKRFSTCCGRGFVHVFQLRADGTLTLEQRRYPFSNAEPDELSETLQGDFWLELREWIKGDRFSVPFRDGKVQLDRSTWKFEPGLPNPYEDDEEDDNG